MGSRMIDFIKKTLIPLIIAIASLLGAFSFKLEYVKADYEKVAGARQEAIGRVIFSLSKDCNQ